MLMVFMLLPLAGISYVSWHLWCLLPLGALWKTLIIVAGVAAFLSLFSIMGVLERLPLNAASAVYEVGTSSVFILLYLVMTFLVLDAGRLLHIIPRNWLYANGMTSIGLLVFIFGLFLYGNLHYQHKVRQPLTLESNGKVKKPLKVVMMSDVHLGYHNRRADLHKWVDMINAEQADLILIGGDIIDISVRPLQEEHMAEEFHRLNAPVYACLGNHEYFSSEPRAQQFYEEAGIHLLRDSVAVVGDLCLIGRDDRTNPHRKDIGQLMKAVDRTKYTILIDHQPYHLEEAEQAGVDFQLSGHTHHGQVWPISWITDGIYECAFGEHQRGHTRYYISSGIGIWGGKFRIGTRSEYVVAEVL